MTTHNARWMREKAPFSGRLVKGKRSRYLIIRQTEETLIGLEEDEESSTLLRSFLGHLRRKGKPFLVSTTLMAYAGHVPVEQARLIGVRRATISHRLVKRIRPELIAFLELDEEDIEGRTLERKQRNSEELKWEEFIVAYFDLIDLLQETFRILIEQEIGEPIREGIDLLEFVEQTLQTEGFSLFDILHEVLEDIAHGRSRDYPTVDVEPQRLFRLLDTTLRDYERGTLADRHLEDLLGRIKEAFGVLLELDAVLDD